MTRLAAMEGDGSEKCGDSWEERQPKPDEVRRIDEHFDRTEWDPSVRHASPGVFTLLRITWKGRKEPQDITMLKEMIKGKSREATARKMKKSKGALDTSIHRMKKKIDP